MVNNLVGTRIRELRKQRKWTQQQLAEKAGIPRATLSTIEKDDANPGLSAVYRIALALEVTVDDLIEENQYRVGRIAKKNMIHLEADEGAYLATTVSPTSVHQFLQQHFHLQAYHTYQGKPHPPGSDEYLYILKGEIILNVAGEKVHLLAGESAFFRANVKHSYTNPQKEKAEAMVSIVSRFNDR